MFQLSNERISIIQINTRPKITFFNSYTPTNYIIPNVKWPHVTLFQLSHDHITQSTKYFTKKCHLIPIAPRPHKTMFQLSHYQCHIFSIITQTHNTFFQFSQDHNSHSSNCHTTTYYIFAIITRPHVILFKFGTTTYNIIQYITGPFFTLLHMSHDQSHIFSNTQKHISIYSNFQTTTWHNFPYDTRPHLTLIQLSYKNMLYCTNCNTITYHITPIFKRWHVIFFQFLHNHI